MLVCIGPPLNARPGLHPRLLDSDTDWAAPPARSHNNQWIAYGCNSQLVQICLIRPDGTGRQVLTSQDQNSGPQWSPNDQWLAFISYRDSNWEVYVMQPDGSQQTRVTTNWLQDFGPTWRP